MGFGRESQNDIVDMGEDYGNTRASIDSDAYLTAT